MGIAGDVVRRDRLLQPDEIERFEHFHGTHGFIDAPGLIGIGHHFDVIGQMPAHCCGALHVLRQRGSAEPHFDRTEAFLDALGRPFEKLFERKVEIDVAGIGADLRIEPAKQTPQGHAEPVALHVPQRDVNGSHCKGQRGTAPGIVMSAVHPVPQPFDSIRIFAHDERAKWLIDHRRDRAALAFMHDGIADAAAAVRIGDADRDHLERLHQTGGAGFDWRRQRYAEAIDFDFSDCRHVHLSSRVTLQVSFDHA